MAATANVCNGEKRPCQHAGTQGGHEDLPARIPVLEETMGKCPHDAKMKAFRP